MLQTLDPTGLDTALITNGEAGGVEAVTDGGYVYSVQCFPLSNCVDVGYTVSGANIIGTIAFAY